MATTIKEDIKHKKEKEVKDTVDDVIIDEKIVLLRDFSALDETATKQKTGC
jgi:hypothetical protein